MGFGFEDRILIFRDLGEMRSCVDVSSVSRKVHKGFFMEFDEILEFFN